jgi:hypothetical protein
MPRPHRRPAGTVGRDLLLVLGLFLVAGVLGGVLWSRVVEPAQFTKLANGGSMGEDQLARQFGSDGWFVVIGAGAGLLLGLLLSLWRSRDPVLTTVLLVVGGGLAAVVAATVGHLLGPGSTSQALAAAKLGGKVAERLDVGTGSHSGLGWETLPFYLSWPVGALLGAVVVLLGGRSEDSPSDTEDAHYA